MWKLFQSKEVGLDNSCHSSPEDLQFYDQTLRIVSVFVLLVVSLLGASLALLSARVKCLHISPIIINTGKFLGTGVILATGFIHMFPSGMESLTDPCLSDDWNAYSAYAGLFAMLSILAMQLIEFIAHHQIHDVPIEDSHVNTGEHNVEVGHSHGVSLLQESHNHKVSTYLLEFGVALHSVLIGVALGTTDSLNFVALFIALCFHQFFEAIALGAQIERLNNKSLIPAISMIIVFALTTPVGIGIGIGIHSRTYNPKSVAALMVNGVLDSVSAGILIYVSLVNLMAGEMGVQAHSSFALKKRFKILYFGALYLGAGAMAVIGRWAQKNSIFFFRVDRYVSLK